MQTFILLCGLVMALFVSQHLYSFSVVHCNDTIEVRCFSIDSF